MCAAMSTKFATLSFTGHDTANAVKSFAMSKTFMQKMIRLGLLNVLYRRLHISETNFIPKKLGDVPFVVFRHGSTDPVIRIYHAWVKGMLDAIDRSYLKDITLLLVNNENNEVVESYKFAIKYNPENDSVKDKAEVKQVTIDLLQVLLQLGNCERLGENVVPDLVFRYHSHTPEEYEPPGFSPSNWLSADNLTQPILLGSINTGFHKLTCRAGGKKLELKVLTQSSTAAELNESVHKSQNDNMADSNNVAEVETSQASISVNVNVTNSNVGETEHSQDNIVNKLNTRDGEAAEMEYSQDTPSLDLENAKKIDVIEETSGRKRKARKLEENSTECLVSGNMSDVSGKKSKTDFNITLSDMDLNGENDELGHISLSSNQSEVEFCKDAINVSCICKLPLPEVPAIMCRICGRRYHMYCHGYVTYESFETSLFRCIKCGTTDGHMAAAEMAQQAMNLARLRLVIGYIFEKKPVPKDFMSQMDKKSQQYITSKIAEMKLFEGATNLNRAMQVVFGCEDSQTFSV